MRVNGQKHAAEMAASAAQLSHSDLKRLGLLDRMRIEQVVNGLVRGQKWQAIGELESPLAQATPLTDPGHAQGGLVDQLQRQARFDRRRRATGPSQ
ncbi:MAG: hypothetical protein NT154_06270 [Verrucomicrobia bacterium]|nr:hypothetical protein [Verrucomicrobiota bacterium]